MIYIRVVLAAITFSLASQLVYSQEESGGQKPEVGIFERLGETIPSGIMLNDENGRQVDVKSLLNKPTVFSLVYFRCPGICSPLLNGVSEVVNTTDLEPGKDFDLITISFEPAEDYKLASEKKKSYLENLDRKIPEQSWRFLTGDSVNIRKIADALGFKFQRQGKDYMHGASVMMVSADGKITRYLYGTEYLPFDFKMAVTEAEEGRVVPTINKLMKMCFSFDPEGRKYVLNVTRISGAAILFMLLVFIGFLTLRKKKVKLNNI